MIVHIEVTQADIDAGGQTEARSCPVARSLQRALRRPLSVGPGSFNFDGEITLTLLPVHVGVFIHDFDRCGARAVSPITFDVET